MLTDTQYDLYNVLIDCGLSSQFACTAVTQPIIGIAIVGSMIRSTHNHAVRLCLQSVSAVLSNM